MTKTFCIYCEKGIIEGITFCPHCGKKQPVPLSDDEKTKDPYEILQVSKNAEIEVIKAAYKGLAKKYHPDANNSPETRKRMRDINWAFEILNDELKRKDWDKTSGTKGNKAQSSYSKPDSSTKKPKRNDSSSGDIRNCPKCGVDNYISRKHCIACGVSFNDKTSAQPKKTTNQPKKTTAQPKKARV